MAEDLGVKISIYLHSRWALRDARQARAIPLVGIAQGVEAQGSA